MNMSSFLCSRSENLVHVVRTNNLMVAVNFCNVRPVKVPKLFLILVCFVIKKSDEDIRFLDLHEKMPHLQ